MLREDSEENIIFDDIINKCNSYYDEDDCTINVNDLNNSTGEKNILNDIGSIIEPINEKIQKDTTYLNHEKVSFEDMVLPYNILYDIDNKIDLNFNDLYKNDEGVSLNVINKYYNYIETDINFMNDGIGDGVDDDSVIIM